MLAGRAFEPGDDRARNWNRLGWNGVTDRDQDPTARIGSAYATAPASPITTQCARRAVVQPVTQWGTVFGDDVLAAARPRLQLEGSLRIPVRRSWWKQNSL